MIQGLIGEVKSETTKETIPFRQDTCALYNIG